LKKESYKKEFASQKEHGKREQQQTFLYRNCSCLGCVVFAASLQPESTGQLVTKSNFGPTTNPNPQSALAPTCGCPLKNNPNIRIDLDSCPMAVSCGGLNCYGTIISSLKPGIKGKEVQSVCGSVCTCDKTYSYKKLITTGRTLSGVWYQMYDRTDCTLSSGGCSVMYSTACSTGTCTYSCTTTSVSFEDYIWPLDDLTEETVIASGRTERKSCS
jgi:hypothetical protein